MSAQAEKLKVVEWWLSRGFAILPAQPNSKYLFKGYGEHQKKITTLNDAAEIIRKFPLVNLVALAGQRHIILDFDLYKVYADWRRSQEVFHYTEQTPNRGFHVFALGDVLQGLRLVPGVELKRACLVYPSIVAGKPYTRGQGDIIEAGDEIFLSLSKPGSPTAHLLRTRESSRKDAVRTFSPHSLVEQIKQHNEILHVFAAYRPDFKPKGMQNYHHVVCPFHDDHKPSMYLDTVRQIYGCHACGAHGDVINLYARFEGISVREAIVRMARNLPRVSR